MFVTSYSVIYCTYIPAKVGFGFHLFAQFIVQIYFVECVNKIVHILSAIYYTIYGAVCFQFTPFPCDDWDNMHALSYNHHQIRSMDYFPLFRVRSWNNGMRCMSRYVLMLCTHWLRWHGHIAHSDGLLKKFQMFYPTLVHEFKGFRVWGKFVFRTLELTDKPTNLANQVKVCNTLDQSCTV